MPSTSVEGVVTEYPIFPEKKSGNFEAKPCSPLTQQMIGQHQGHHCLGHWHNSGRYGRIVPAYDPDLRRLA
jgi:hypothetical protein